MNDYDLILDYLTGSPVVPDEFKRAIHRWIIGHADDPEQVNAMRKVWERELTMHRDDNDLAGLSEVMSEIDPDWEDSKISEFTNATEHRRPRFREMVRKSAKYAAASALMVVIAAISYFIYDKYYTADTVVLAAAEGVTAEYTLPDGSMVRLNSNSRLSYDSHSFAKYRTVALEGEGYFDVAHEASHPFSVDMSGFKIEVLGTTFDAKNYSHSPLKEVVLLSGKVKVEEDAGKGSVTLYPDQRYIYDSDTGMSAVENVEAQEYCNWHLDSYKIEKEPLRKLLVFLSRKYCLDLEIDPDVDVDREISITITDEPVESTMGTISYVADFEYEIKGNTLRIKNRSN